MKRLTNIGYLIMAMAVAGSSSTTGLTSSWHCPRWPGWEHITHMVVFGDSYTTTGFNISLAQPSHANPLGNPAYPGYTATNGPNWVDFLTTTYNASFLETVNLAYGGATVDSALVQPYLPTVLSLKDQIQQEYIPRYSRHPHPRHFDWEPETTLFASFLGINDVGNAYANSNASAVLSESIAEYAQQMETLYHTGARNFLILNVPPVDRSPLTIAAGSSAQHQEAEFIAAWNRNLTHLAQNLSTTYPDASTFVFDTYALFTAVLDAPCAYAQTCAYANTTDYCESYENGTASWYSYYRNCSIPVDEYFWLNSLHPTFRVMNVTAELIAEELRQRRRW